MDRETRDLDRQAHGGDLTSAVRALRQRVRSGEVAEDRVRLAALLFDPASRALLGADAPQIPKGYQDWLNAIRAHGPEATMRASIVVARSMAPVYERLLQPSDPEHPLPVIEAAERAVVSPSLPHVKAVLLAAQRCREATQAPTAVQLGPWQSAAVSACVALATVFGLEPNQPWQVMIHARLAAFGLVDAGARSDDETLVSGAGWVVRDAICTELRPWALAEGDPVRERVAQRGELEIQPSDLETQG